MFERFYNLDDPEPIAQIKDIEEEDGVKIFRLCGCINGHSMPQNRMILEKMDISEKPLQKHIILDFANVSDIDSSIVAVMTAAASEMNENGHKLIIINVKDEFMEIIKPLRSRNRFEICDSEEEARQLLTQ